MAKECAFCGKPLGLRNSAYDIPNSKFSVCESHLAFRAELKDVLSADAGANTDDIVQRFKDSILSVHPSFYAAMEAMLKEVKERTPGYQEYLKKRNEEAEKLAPTLMLTTGSLFDGYTVEKYVDVICAEVVFKNSFMKQVGAGFEDLGNAFSFAEREMTGASELISNARTYTLEKFRRKAAHMGANAVLGVEFESSLGSDVVKVCISGTAVVIKKKQDA